MKSPASQSIALVLCGSFVLPSCDNPAAMAAIGGGIGAIAGNEIGGSGGAIIGGLAGAAIGYSIGRANANQKRIAEERAARALRQQSVRENVKRKKVRYVAVPVPKAEDQPGPNTQLMKVNAETGKPTGEVYAPKTAVHNGDQIQLGGESAVYYGSTVNNA